MATFIVKVPTITKFIYYGQKDARHQTDRQMDKNTVHADMVVEIVTRTDKLVEIVSKWCLHFLPKNKQKQVKPNYFKKHCTSSSFLLT